MSSMLNGISEELVVDFSQHGLVVHLNMCKLSAFSLSVYTK